MFVLSLCLSPVAFPATYFPLCPTVMEARALQNSLKRRMLECNIIKAIYCALSPQHQQPSLGKTLWWVSLAVSDSVYLIVSNFLLFFSYWFLIVHTG